MLTLYHFYHRRAIQHIRCQILRSAAATNKRDVKRQLLAQFIAYAKETAFIAPPYITVAIFLHLMSLIQFDNSNLFDGSHNHSN